MRYQLTLDVDLVDPDLTRADIEEAAKRAAEAATLYLGDAWVDVDSIEELGT